MSPQTACAFSVLDPYHRAWWDLRACVAVPMVRDTIAAIVRPRVWQALREKSPDLIERAVAGACETVLDKLCNSVALGDIQTLSGDVVLELADVAANRWCRPEDFEQRLRVARRRRRARCVSQWPAASLPCTGDCDLALRSYRSARLACEKTCPDMRRRLIRMARRALGGATEVAGHGAEDVAQFVLVAVLDSSRRTKPVANWPGYCQQTAYRVVVDLYDGRIVEQADVDDIAAPSDEPRSSVEDALVQRERLAAVYDAFSTLSPNQRSVLYLRLQGLANRDVARQLGITSDSAKTTYSQALKRLKKLFT